MFISNCKIIFSCGGKNKSVLFSKSSSSSPVRASFFSQNLQDKSSVDLPQKSGFSFDLCKRNDMLTQKGLSFLKTGTTIVGLIFQGLRWYAKRLRVDEDGDVAVEFLEEGEKQINSEDDHNCIKTMPKLQIKHKTKPAKVRGLVVSSDGKLHQCIEHQGRLLIVLNDLKNTEMNVYNILALLLDGHN